MPEHQSHSIYTEEELQLLEQAKQRNQFSNHHHHHHHTHVKYQRPKQLTTSIALYSLKKLSAMQPKFLTYEQKRLLNPVAPGLLSYLVHGGFVVGFGSYAFYVYKGLGLKGFGSKAVIPLIGIFGVMQAVEYSMAYSRQFLFQNQRRELVKKYIGKYGQNYLLDSLDPSFRI